MSDVTGVQMSEYLKLDQNSPYTALFQHIFDTLKPKPKNVESKNMEDGEIEEDNPFLVSPETFPPPQPGRVMHPLLGKVQADSRKREDSKPEEPSERSLDESTSREKKNTSRGNKRRNKKKKKDKRRKTMDSSERCSGSEKEEETRPMEFKGFDFKVLYDLDNNPMRRRWLKRYMEFMISKGKSLTQCPSICKVRPVLSNL